MSETLSNADLNFCASAGAIYTQDILLLAKLTAGCEFADAGVSTTINWVISFLYFCSALSIVPSMSSCSLFVMSITELDPGTIEENLYVSSIGDGSSTNAAGAIYDGFAGVRLTGRACTKYRVSPINTNSISIACS